MSNMSDVSRKFKCLAIACAAVVGSVVAGSPAAAKQPALPYQCQASPKNELVAMIHVDGAFARASNSWESGAVGRMLKFQCYRLIGRDAIGEWFYAHFGAGAVWIHHNDVRLKDGETPEMLKVLSPADLLVSTPVSTRFPGVPTVSAAIKERYRAAARAGRAANMVTVTGDCNSEPPVFFGRFSTGIVNLSGAPELQRAAAYYAPSFKRASAATSGSFSAITAFDGTWTDPAVCGAGEGPFACELRKSNASIVIIALGTGDTFTWQTFEGNYRRVIDYALQYNVVPVLMTKADLLESQQGGASVEFINNTVRRVGAEYGLPVIDFALAVKGLPNGGLVEERNTDGKSIQPFHINEEAMDARIVMTLQTLSQFGSVPAAKPTRAPRPVRQPVKATPKP